MKREEATLIAATLSFLGLDLIVSAALYLVYSIFSQSLLPTNVPASNSSVV